MNSGANNQANLNNLPSFTIMVRGKVVGYQSWPHIHKTKLFQRPRSCAIPTVSELCGYTLTCNKGFTYDLHKPIHTF